jgi:hypothetical protein
LGLEFELRVWLGVHERDVEPPQALADLDAQRVAVELDQGLEHVPAAEGALLVAAEHLHRGG